MKSLTNTIATMGFCKCDITLTISFKFSLRVPCNQVKILYPKENLVLKPKQNVIHTIKCQVKIACTNTIQF